MGFSMDFLDGFLARQEKRRGRSNPSKEAVAIGPWLDAESDALGIYFSGLVLVLMDWAPGILLVPLLARYAFGILFSLFPLNMIFPPWYRWTSKTIAAILQFSLGAIWITRLNGVPWLTQQIPVLASTAAVLILSSFLMECYFRGQRLKQLFSPGSGALLRSWLIYYGVPFFLLPWRYYRMKKLYSQFIRPGDLVMDVGAHIGNRIVVFEHLQARVKAFEPQPSCGPLLREWFAPSEQVTLANYALGPQKGEMPLFISPQFPTLTTLDAHWVQSRKGDPLFEGIQWHKAGAVPVNTLDQEIKLEGIPAFIKLDVEGFEGALLEGNHYPLPALSFEFLPSDPQRGLKCLKEINRLGRYEYNFSVGESMKLAWKWGKSQEEMEDFLKNYPWKEKSGDIYARRLE